MNKRIKELALQSYETVRAVTGGEYVAFNTKKFAELIVKECTGIVEDAVNHREPASTYVGKIKQHFGVEE